jgi:hypothetical protein
MPVSVGGLPDVRCIGEVVCLWRVLELSSEEIATRRLDHLNTTAAFSAALEGTVS